MNLKVQKHQAARTLKVGKKRVWVDSSRAADIKKAVTKEDIRGLIAEGAIRVKQKKGVSKGKARKALAQKRKGRRKGPGSRKGKKGARVKRKRLWTIKVRLLRKFVSNLKKKKVIDKKMANELRRHIKGDMFRDVSHLKLHLKSKGVSV